MRSGLPGHVLCFHAPNCPGGILIGARETFKKNLSPNQAMHLIHANWAYYFITRFSEE